MIPFSLIVEQLLPTIADAVRRGEPVYVIPPEERQPEISVRADMLGMVLAEQRDWGHANLGLEALHQKGHAGAGVLVAICDTGIDVDHPDLKARIRATGNKDFTGSNNGFRDAQGHGTHCAGIACASSDGSGIVGAAPAASLIAVKVLSNEGSGASSWIAAGIRHAGAQGAGVISLSLGGPSPDPHTRAAIQEVVALPHRPWVVCAAGNDGREAGSYPGHYPESVAVAATDKNNARASFSTLNRENDVSAPGVSIWSTLPNARYGSMSGTSMATPYVAGCLALVRGALLAVGRAIPPQRELLAALEQTSTDLGQAGRDSATGWGLINTLKLIELLVGTAPPVEPPPVEPPPVPPPPTQPPPVGGGRFRVSGLIRLEAARSKPSVWSVSGGPAGRVVINGEYEVAGALLDGTVAPAAGGERIEIGGAEPPGEEIT